MAKKKSTSAADRPTDPETEEKQRLRSLALSRKLVSKSSAIPAAPLPPSNSVVKLDGRDIARRGQRKSRYLFSFPGLLAPLAGGGRVGELSDLASKNPVLYLEFPKGRMKLFGTHVYPKNKYLSLQLTKSAKGVMLEDIFESMIVFSDVWWIGKKEDNPEELQLQFPNLSEGQDAPYDFRGGAGGILEEPLGNNKLEKDSKEPLSPDINSDHDLSDDDSDTKPGTESTSVIELTPIRQSARTAGKKLSYAEYAGVDSTSSDTEVSDEKTEKDEDTYPTTSDVVTPERTLEKRTSMAEKIEKSTLSQKVSQKERSSKKGSLVQATLSTLFEKAADKNPKRKVEKSSGPKGPVGKRQKSNLKQSTEHAKGSKGKESEAGGKKNGSRGAPRKLSKVALDDIEIISSESQDDSDEDWA